jgi:hypothetical protein
MREELGLVAQSLAAVEDPLSRAAAKIIGILEQNALSRISLESV